MKFRASGHACLAVALSAVVIALAPQAATAASTPAGGTAVTPVVGQAKSQGSGLWGYIGDIDTQAGATYTYGLAFDPTDESLTVTDSGKVVYSSFGCSLSGFPASPCQTGTPRVFDYPLQAKTAGVDEVSFTQYLNDGIFAGSASATNSDGVNAGLGRKYASVGERTVRVFPVAEAAQHGPRGVTYTNDGTAWVVDSEAVAPVGGKPGAIKRYGQGLTPASSDAGWTGAWAQKDQPGVHFYRTGAATTPLGTVLVNSEVSDRLQEYGADGTWLRSIKLDLPKDAGGVGDPGYRNPYAVGVDPVDGSIYLPLINFRDDAYWQSKPAFVEKRDASGKVLSSFGQGHLGTRQVVFGIAVEPKTRDVFVWTQAGNLQQFTKDGTWVREFTSGEFPGLTAVRGVAFDPNGRMYITVAEGTNRTRVMILGKTPDPVAAATCSLTAKGVNLSWQNTSKVAEGAKAPYQQSTLLDFVVERSPKGANTWAVMPKAAASSELSREILGADAATFDYRISGWNEAGNGNTAVVSCSAAAPGIKVTKTINGISAQPWPSVEPGAPLTVGFTVTNTGNSELGDIKLTDQVGNEKAVAVSCPKVTLAVNESMACSTLTIHAPEQGVHTDTATVTGVGAGSPVAGTSQASAIVVPRVTPSPTPTPTPAPITVTENPDKSHEVPLADTGFGLTPEFLLLAAASMLIGGALIRYER